MCGWSYSNKTTPFVISRHIFIISKLSFVYYFAHFIFLYTSFLISFLLIWNLYSILYLQLAITSFILSVIYILSTLIVIQRFTEETPKLLYPGLNTPLVFTRYEAMEKWLNFPCLQSGNHNNLSHTRFLYILKIECFSSLSNSAWLRVSLKKEKESFHGTAFISDLSLFILLRQPDRIGIS